MLLGCRVACDDALSGGFSHAQPIRRQIGALGWLSSNKQPLEQFNCPAGREVDDDLMVPHPLAALHWTQVFHDAVVTVAHSS
jgi:hypothetical protein